ncbi:MAG: UvrD-helicase domain-containing protein [Bacteroidota bacterium]
MSSLKIISAGAGSGKTYRLTQEMVQLLKSGVRASGIIATTFTTKAAAELQERVRVKLLEEGLVEEANDLTNALIGTVHGLGVKLLKRFAFIAGVSPEVDIIADEDQQVLFNKSLATVLRIERIQEMEHYSNRLGLNKQGYYDWRREVKELTDAARANDFSAAVLEQSKKKSIESFRNFLEQPSTQDAKAYSSQLLKLLEDTIEELEGNADETKVTQGGINTLKVFRNTLKLKGELNWHEWIKISKIKVGAKSRDAVVELAEFAKTHDAHPDFHHDIENYLSKIFDIAIEAIQEYETYKKQRGLIDYIDMEIMVKRLLDHPQVQEILAEELDLLMVDEFQDTNPIQLEIFLKLSNIAQHSIWVGDPKQSIYGFRGAEPRLMQAIIQQNGGIKEEDIQEYSWRSREEIVYLTNALFSKAFKQIPVKQVALKAKRTRLDNPEDPQFKAEPIQMGDALIHWNFQYDGEGRRLPGRPWMENCVASAVAKMLERQILVLPKGAKKVRQVQAGDIAILCRSNKTCQEMAEALHRAGLKAAIARNGLLSTAEVRLVLACLKYVLHKRDSLSVAEIMLLAGDKDIETIIDERLKDLEQYHNDFHEANKIWGQGHPLIDQLNELRPKMVELSSTESLNLILEELNLRRIIAPWGKVGQRMENIDVLRHFTLKYEEACQRLHTGASLGGFMLYLNDLENKGVDTQGSGEGPDAVQVLTYHKSKGLEWPAVICYDLEGNLRERVWGMNIVADSEQVDLDNILGNRWLRYWINPYADQYRNTKLEERINNSQVKKAAHEQALQEEARLLYVGITRARDYLVFPTRERPTKWLNRCWHEGQEDYPTLDANSHETPWHWNGIDLTTDTEIMLFPKDFPSAEPSEEVIHFLGERAGRKEYEAYEIKVENENWSRKYQSKIHTPIQLSQAYSFIEGQNYYQLAKMTKAFLIADHVTDALKDRQNKAEGLIERYEVEDQTDADHLIQLGDHFFNWLSKRFVVKQMYRKYPIRYRYQNRLFETIIDFVVETSEGWVIVQNSGFSGDQSKWKKKAKELGPWMYLSRLAIMELFETKKVQTWVHFVLLGFILEVNTTAKQSKPTEANP